MTDVTRCEARLDSGQWTLRDLLLGMFLLCLTLAWLALARSWNWPPFLMWATWSALIAVNYLLALGLRSLRTLADPRWANAFGVTITVDRIHQCAWGLTTLLLLYDPLDMDHAQLVARLMFAPLVLWVPVCAVANSISFVLVCDLSHRAFVLFRLNSVLSLLVAIVWILTGVSY